MQAIVDSGGAVGIVKALHNHGVAGKASDAALLLQLMCEHASCCRVLLCVTYFPGAATTFAMLKPAKRRCLLLMLSAPHLR